MITKYKILITKEKIPRWKSSLFIGWVLHVAMEVDSCLPLTSRPKASSWILESSNESSNQASLLREMDSLAPQACTKSLVVESSAAPMAFRLQLIH